MNDPQSDTSDIITSPQNISKVGRKSLYKPSIVNKILEALKKGYNQQDSAIIGGINPDTYYSWIKLYPEFSDAIKKAMVFNKATRIDRISKHGITNWQADAWYLERMFPQEFALKTVTEHTSKVDNEITIRIVPDIPQGISDKQRKQIEQAFIEGEVQPDRQELNTDSHGDSNNITSKDTIEGRGEAPFGDTVGVEGLDIQDVGSMVEPLKVNQKPPEPTIEGLEGQPKGIKTDEISQYKPIVSYREEEGEEEV